MQAFKSGPLMSGDAAVHGTFSRDLTGKITAIRRVAVRETCDPRHHRGPIEASPEIYWIITALSY